MEQGAGGGDEGGVGTLILGAIVIIKPQYPITVLCLHSCYIRWLTWFRFYNHLPFTRRRLLHQRPAVWQRFTNVSPANIAITASISVSIAYSFPQGASLLRRPP